MDPKDLLPDLSLLTPDKKTDLYHHAIGIAEIYASLTKSTLDDILVQAAKKIVGPVVIGEIQSVLAGSADASNLSPEAILALLQMVQAILSWLKK